MEVVHFLCMEERAKALHDSIVQEVEARKWDIYENKEIKHSRIDVLVSNVISQQQEMDSNKKSTSGRSKFAFTEPYWRKWNSDLAILEQESAKELKAVVKKRKPFKRERPNKNIITHRFGVPSI